MASNEKKAAFIVNKKKLKTKLKEWTLGARGLVHHEFSRSEVFLKGYLDRGTLVCEQRLRGVKNRVHALRILHQAMHTRRIERIGGIMRETVVRHGKMVKVGNIKSAEAQIVIRVNGIHGSGKQPRVRRSRRGINVPHVVVGRVWGRFVRGHGGGGRGYEGGRGFQSRIELAVPSDMVHGQTERRGEVVGSDVAHIGAVLGSGDGGHIGDLGIVERETTEEGVVGFACGFGLYVLLLGRVKMAELMFNAEIVKEGHDGIAFVGRRRPGTSTNTHWLRRRWAA